MLLGVFILLAIVVPAGRAQFSSFSINTTSTIGTTGQLFFDVCYGSLPSPPPVPTGSVAMLPSQCTQLVAGGLTAGPVASGVGAIGTADYIIAPASVAAATGTVYFQGWAVSTAASPCVAVSCNLSATAPISSTNTTYYLQTATTGALNMLAVYGPSQTSNQTSTISSSTWLIIGLVALVAVAAALSSGGRRTKR